MKIEKKLLTKNVNTIYILTKFFLKCILESYKEVEKE